jgi:hypothetical protein
MAHLIQTDAESQPFVNVGNIRVTLVKKTGWAGPRVHHYLRVQGYRAEDGTQLFHGAELPLGDPQAGYRLLSAIAHLIGEKFCPDKNAGEQTAVVGQKD